MGRVRHIRRVRVPRADAARRVAAGRPVAGGCRVAPGPGLGLGLAVLAACSAGAWAAEPAVTVLADYEDASVAAGIGEVRNVLAADCAVRRVSIPARGQGCLMLEIGATARDVSVVCDLTFREAVRFRNADRIATFCWLNEGEFQLAFRLHDARGQVYETEPQRVHLPHRWVRVAADLAPAGLRPVRGAGPPAEPLEVEGYRVATDRLGKQTLYLDDLQIEHRVDPLDLVRGDFQFDEPTRIYEPGSTVRAAVVLENRSREKQLQISVDLAWTRQDGSTLATQRAAVSLPPGGDDFRSYRKLDFSQAIRDPGLYQLVARARAPGWAGPNTFATTIAVTPSNRRLARGRSTFFGARSNLLREPDLDQMLEINLARDIGVNLLALEVPWRRVQPKSDTFDFAPLDPLLEALARRDIAALAVLTEPPAWLPADAAARRERAVLLIDALATRFGGRLPQYQLDAAVLGEEDPAAQLAAARQVHAAVARSHPQASVLPPAVVVGDATAAGVVADLVKANPDFPLVFATEGDVERAAARLEELRRDGGFLWQPLHRWQHTAAPLRGAGHPADAESVLRHYVRAAAAGLGGLIWSDLRDDDNDPREPEQLRGLVRRDFSPKTTLLGYAAAAGQLTGYRCAGPVFGAPPDFESGVFIGADRHVAVLLPRPNRILPAVLAPLRGVPGELTAQDFERRALPVFESAAPPLVATVPRPAFLTLRLAEMQPEAQLGLGPPWLRVPATVFCGHGTRFTIEIDVPVPLQRSYVQLQVPPGAPVQSSFSAAGLQGEAGQTIAHEVRLWPAAGQEPRACEIVLRIALEGQILELPLAVRPLTNVRPRSDATPVRSPAHRIAALAAPDGTRPTADGTLLAAYDADALYLVLTLQDDRLIPTQTAPDGSTRGDRLLIGVAREGHDRHAEAALDPAAAEPRLEPVHGTSAEQLSGWGCALDAGQGEGKRIYRITIPRAALGGPPLAAGERLLLAVRYVDADAEGVPPVVLEWGRGLDGRRSTQDYEWIRLATPAGDAAP